MLRKKKDKKYTSAFLANNDKNDYKARKNSVASKSGNSVKIYTNWDSCQEILGLQTNVWVNSTHLNFQNHHFLVGGMSYLNRKNKVIRWSNDHTKTDHHILLEKKYVSRQEKGYFGHNKGNCGIKFTLFLKEAIQIEFSILHKYNPINICPITII